MIEVSLLCWAEDRDTNVHWPQLLWSPFSGLLLHPMAPSLHWWSWLECPASGLVDREWTSFDVLSLHFDEQLVPPSTGGLVADFILINGFCLLHRPVYLLTCQRSPLVMLQAFPFWSTTCRTAVTLDSLTRLSYFQAFACCIAFLWR